MHSLIVFVYIAVSSLHPVVSLKAVPGWIRSIAIATRVQATPSPQVSKNPQTPKRNYNLWETISKNAKERVKDYFIKRATDGGIPWKKYYDLGATNMDILLQNSIDVSEPSIVYPAYYTLRSSAARTTC